VDFVNLDPANPAFRARLAACFIRAGMFDDAEDQISACLKLCEGRVIHPSKRLLLVALRRRALAASRRRVYLADGGFLGA
jgi:hypothetical protein